MAQSLKNDPLVSLSTQVAEPATIEIDETSYDVLGEQNIGRSEEVTLMTLFKQHEQAQRDFDGGRDKRKITAAAERMRNTRLEIITTFTTIPLDVADKLPLVAQAQLLDIIAREMGFTNDADDGE